MSKSTSPSWMLYALILATALLIVAGVAIWYYWDLSEQRADAITTLQTEITTKNNELAQANTSIETLEGTLANTEEELDETEDNLRSEKKKNDVFEDQIRAITGTVADLDKLSKTDEELLQKYSKVYFLNENYIPSDLEQIDDRYILEGRDVQFFHASALPFLEDLLDDARRDDMDLKITSAYRSFDYQHDLKDDFTTLYGEGANAFSADQGYSEHQLGTTVDLTTPEVGGTYQSFAETEAYEWLLQNAHKHGFTLSYPEGNEFYIFEPWHWRFVGEELAEDLHDDDAHFYDWDQREIDQYLIKIFD